MRADEYRHEFLQELLAGSVIREECVPVHEIQVALIGVRASGFQLVYLLGGLQTQQIVQPLLNWVVVSVPNRLV